MGGNTVVFLVTALVVEKECITGSKKTRETH